MLILTRHPGETLIIELPTGEQIQVRIGTDAAGRYFDCAGGVAGEVAG